MLAATTECLGALLPLADVHGFFVMAALKQPEQTVLNRAGSLADHPSFLGWLLKGPWDATDIACLRGASGALVGVEIAELSAGVALEGVDFIACNSRIAAQLSRWEETSPLPPLLLLGVGPDSPHTFGRVE